MNKKYIIAAIVLLLFILSLGTALFLSKRSRPEAPAPVTVENSLPSPQPSPSQPKSLRDLLGMGVSQQCTFSTNETSGSTTGTIYINSGKVRGDIVTSAAGGSTTTHMIVNGPTTYIWMDNNTSGFKMSFNPALITGTPPPSQPGSINPDQPADYRCSSWTADTALFTVPANVTFSDLSTVILPTAGAQTSPTDKCASCNYLSGTAKSQCLSTLGCPSY